MSLDGIILSHLKNELSEAVGLRVYKIYQPSLNEIILSMRGYDKNCKILMSCSTNNPRVHFTNYGVNNPSSPPMFCMLLRKRLSSAKLLKVRQNKLERVLYFDFEAKNEIGDNVKVTLIIEVMGKYSNIILINNEGNIIDCIKRVSSDMSSKRMILPGMHYENPPAQDKICILDDDYKIKAFERVMSVNKELTVSKAISESIQGISLVSCKEVAKCTGIDPTIRMEELKETDIKKIDTLIGELGDITRNLTGKPYILIDKNDKMKDICFIKAQESRHKEYPEFSELLDNYYYEKDKAERIYLRTSNIVKKVNSIISRKRRKIISQNEELKACENREKYKMYGDLLTANLHILNKGENQVLLDNFYSESMEKISIPLNPAFNGVRNSQIYYKKYRKAVVAQKILEEQISKAQDEIKYLESVLDFLSRAESENDILEIQRELYEQKYIKISNRSLKVRIEAKNPLEFKTEEGLRVLVGRNSKQNDKLTLKMTNKEDLWFHVKDIPGTHTILFTNGQVPSDNSILYAANISAIHSKAKDSSNVAVDYTKVRNVKKPSGAKPGMVNYTNYRTIYVTPDKSKIKEYK